MTKNVITINGKEYPVEFAMDTMINFEQIVNKSFFETEFKTLLDRMALIVAAVVTADDQTTLNVDDLKGSNDLNAVQQIILAYSVVDKLMAEFFKVPDNVKKSEDADDAEKQEKPEDSKN